MSRGAGRRGRRWREGSRLHVPPRFRGPWSTEDDKDPIRFLSRDYLNDLPALIAHLLERLLVLVAEPLAFSYVVADLYSMAFAMVSECRTGAAARAPPARRR